MHARHELPFEELVVQRILAYLWGATRMGGKARRITEWQGGSFLFWSGGASALGLGGDGEG